MNYCPIYQTVAGSEEFLEASMTQQGIWVNLLFYCSRVENYGRIVGFGGWTARKVMRVLRVPLAKIKAKCALWVMEGDDLLVFGYPVEQQVNLEYRRKVLADNLNRLRVLDDAEVSGEVEEACAARVVDSSNPRCVTQLTFKGVDVVPVKSAAVEVVAGGDVSVVPDQAPAPEPEVVRVMEVDALVVEQGRERVAVEPVESAAWYVGIGRDLTQDEIKGLLPVRPSLMDDPVGFADYSKRVEALQCAANQHRAKVVEVEQVRKVSRRDVYVRDMADADQVFRAHAGGNWESLVACVNVLMPGWRKMPRLSSFENLALKESLENVKAMGADDWLGLWRYYRKFAGVKGAYWAPVSRQRFLEGFADVVGHCLRWRG